MHYRKLQIYMARDFKVPSVPFLISSPMASNRWIELCRSCEFGCVSLGEFGCNYEDGLDGFVWVGDELDEIYTRFGFGFNCL